MSEFLQEKGVEIRCEEEVLRVLAEDGKVRGVVTSRGEYSARAVIIAPGRVGADWVGEICREFGLNVSQRGIEVGVRVETHNDVMRDITDVVYDPTFFVRTKRYDDQTRTFCTNPGGYIALDRITSYNVCYTKLLRTSGTTGRRSSGGPRDLPPARWPGA